MLQFLELVSSIIGMYAAHAEQIMESPTIVSSYNFHSSMNENSYRSLNDQIISVSITEASLLIKNVASKF